MYLLGIDKHIIYVELEGNFFNGLTSFNTNAHSCNGDVLINLNVIDAWYSGIKNIMYVTNCANICWALKVVFSIFQMQVFASILFSLQLILMAFNYFVMVLSIFVK